MKLRVKVRTVDQVFTGKNIAYAVFSTTDSGKEYMVKGNFGNNEKLANDWKSRNEKNVAGTGELVNGETIVITKTLKYPNGLYVKKLLY